MYTLKKSLGQHFLHDKVIIQQIVDATKNLQAERLVEIGPGGGALTEHLLKLPNTEFKAIEVDDDKVNYLQNTFPEIKDKLIHKDILKTDVPFDLNFSIVGNFPYNISSPIMFRILEWEDKVDHVVGMFQKEVAKRIASGKGSKDYGILSVLLQVYYKVTYLFDVPPNAFTPPPKVMSGVILLEKLNNPYNINDKKAFTRFVKACFQQRRKTLRNGLKSYYSSEILAHEVFNLRVEQLDVAEFVNVYKNILGHEQ